MSDWSSTLYNGYNGLLAMANNLTVIGNNIANSGTTGYKAASTSFEDLFSSLDEGNQIGNGAQLSSIKRNQFQGSLEPTNISTNMAISGEGFFMVRAPGDRAQTGEITNYTRDGNFRTIASHPGDPNYAPDTLKLVNSLDYSVQGRNIASTASPTPADTFEDIMIKTVSPPKATTAIDLSLNLAHDPNKVESKNDPLYLHWDGSQRDSHGTPTPIAAQAFDYHETIKIFDPDGNPQYLSIYFDHTDDPLQQEFLVTCDPQLDQRLIENSGNRYNSGPTPEKGAGALLYGTLQFNSNGELRTIASYKVPADGNVAHTTATNRIQLGRGEGADKFSYNFNGLASGETSATLQFGNTSQPQAVTSRGAASEQNTGANGTPITPLTSWSNVYDQAGKQVRNGDILTFTGSKGDGTPVTYSYSVNTTKQVGDLLANLANQFGATATLDHGALHLEDQLPGESQLAISAIGYTDKNGKTPATNATLAELFGPQNESFATTAFNRYEPGVIPTTNYASPYATLFKNVNGLTKGYLEEISVNKDGILTGRYSNGDIVKQAQVMLAHFVTLEELESIGGNKAQPINKDASRTVSVAQGQIIGSTLEDSNVDMTREMSDLVLTQRSFQANAKSIAAADQLFDKLMAMKR